MSTAISSISHSFETRSFRPSWFATNPHFQTIIGTLFRKETKDTQNLNVTDLILSSSTNREDNKPTFQWDHSERIETPDSDFFHVDWKYHRCHPNCDASLLPIALICHGLETNSNSPLCQEMATACNNQGMDAACINFRGCSGECNLTPKGYHVGYTEDLLMQIQRLNGLYPRRRIYLSGFPLGAGVVTKLLTEIQDQSYLQYNIAGAAVNAIPFDLSQCSASLNEDRFAKRVYGDHILKSMKKRMHQQYDMCDFPFERSSNEECQSIMDVENLVIASTIGFDDAWDCYNQCKTIDVLDRVHVLQYILQSVEAPFFSGIQYPDNSENSPIHIQYTEHGGHCGYIFQTEQKDKEEVSWMPIQLARFLAHVEAAFDRNNEAFDGKGVGVAADKQRIKR